MKKEIQELVQFALSDKLNQHKSIIIGTVNKMQSDIIEQFSGVNIYGCNRIIDTSLIRHVISKHGSPSIEEKKEQIAITIDDFILIPTVLTNADFITYEGKNNLKRDCFKYTKKLADGTIIIIEAVIINKYGNKMVIETMYKKKKSNKK